MAEVLNTKKTLKIKPIDVLNYLDLFYLRLYAHGIKRQEICGFLEVDGKRLSYMKRYIMFKCRINNWLKIMEYAFNIGVLQKKDYVEQVIKEQAYKYANDIFRNQIGNKKKSISTSNINSKVVEFFYVCNSLLCNEYNKYPNEDKLTSIEKKYLNLKYSHFNVKSNLLQFSKNKEQLLRKSIFKKLKSHNWFNVFRKALQYNLIIQSNNSYLSFDNYLRLCVHSIVECHNTKDLSSSEKELLIYESLLDLYSNFEFEKLFSYERY